MKYKKIIKSVMLFLGMLMIVFLGPIVIWNVLPSTEKTIVMVDKTVPDTIYREHRGFTWITNYLKMINPITKKTYDYKKDYYGFFPLENYQYTENTLPDDLAPPDFIYLLDTYGVYHKDFYEAKINDKQTEIITGGISEKEVDILEKALNENCIIGEFNILGSPTSDSVRSRLEDIFGVTWNGWIGRYYKTLSSSNPEIPPWLVKQYVLTNGKRWEFSGPGIVFLDKNDNLVILSEKETGENFVEIQLTDESAKIFNVKNKVRYNYWFDVLIPHEGTEVLGNYTLDLTAAGEKMLEENGIPKEFPAIVKKTDNYISYYFAGDYADSKATPNIYSFYGLPWFNKITTIEDDANQNYFYWNVYYPMIKSILINP